MSGISVQPHETIQVSTAWRRERYGITAWSAQPVFRGRMLVHYRPERREADRSEDLSLQMDGETTVRLGHYSSMYKVARRRRDFTDSVYESAWNDSTVGARGGALSRQSPMLAKTLKKHRTTRPSHLDENL